MSANGTRPAETRPAGEPPWSPEAEAAVLGCMLGSSDDRAFALESMQAEQFYWPAHRTLFALIRDMDLAGQPIDPVTVDAEARRLGLDNDLGGASGIFATLEAAPAYGAIRTYAAEVASLAMRRRVLDVATILAIAARRPDTDPDASAAQAMDDLARLIEGGHADWLLDGSAIVAEMDAAIERWGRGDFVRWGLADLDEITECLQPGRLVLIGARPGLGKTSIALQVAARAAETVRVIIASYEFAVRDVGAKLVASMASYPAADVNKPDALRSSRVVEARERLRTLGTEVVRDQLPIDVLCSRITASHRRSPVSLVVVDYIQLVPPADYRLPREQQVAGVSRALKMLALRLDIPVLACVQLRREDRRPQLNDLRESGALEQDADQVVLLYREDDNPGKVIADVAKNRWGPIDRAHLAWRAAPTVFADLARHEAGGHAG